MDWQPVYALITTNWLGISSLIATIIIGFTTTFATIRYRNKQRQMNGLLEAFKILNTREHRSSRKKVYELYLRYEKSKDVTVFENSAEVIDVRADFDVIGTLVKSGNVNEKLFLIEYGPLAYRCWVYLKNHIETERKKRNFDPFMENFEDLAEKAHKFWLKKGHDVSKTLLYSPENLEET
jgi:hypothetical protein